MTQLFTLGESDLIDLELIYMTGYEPALFFWIESLLLPFMQLPSIIWVSLTWYVYAAEVFWFFAKIFFWAAFADNEDITGGITGSDDDKKDGTDKTADDAVEWFFFCLLRTDIATKDWLI